MASAKENVPVAPQPPLPRQTSSSSPRPPPPLRPKMANGAAEPPPVSGVLKCTCFRLPSRTKKTLPPPRHPAPKLRSASRRSGAVAPDVLAAASESQRVTFRASASLSTWWPPSPSDASAGVAAGATATPAPAGGGGGSVVSPRRASASSAVSPTSSSFSHWRCRSVSSSRVTPRGERASFFSFPVSPASASSSCMSTPKIPRGWQQ